MNLFEEEAREIRGVMSNYEKGMIPFDEYQRQMKDVSERYEKVIQDDYRQRTFWLHAGAAFCIVAIAGIVLALVLFSLGYFGW